MDFLHPLGLAYLFWEKRPSCCCFFVSLYVCFIHALAQFCCLMMTWVSQKIFVSFWDWSCAADTIGSSNPCPADLWEQFRHGLEWCGYFGGVPEGSPEYVTRMRAAETTFQDSLKVYVASIGKCIIQQHVNIWFQKIVYSMSILLKLDLLQWSRSTEILRLYQLIRRMHKFLLRHSKCKVTIVFFLCQSNILPKQWYSSAQYKGSINTYEDFSHML
jgi:hypothetical protein